MASLTEQIDAIEHRIRELQFQSQIESNPRRRQFIERKVFALASRSVKLLRKLDDERRALAPLLADARRRQYRTLRAAADSIDRMRRKAKR